MNSLAMETHEFINDNLTLKQAIERSKKELIVKLGMMFIVGQVTMVSIILGVMSVMLK